MNQIIMTTLFALANSNPVKPPNGFSITLENLSGNTKYDSYFTDAAKRWEKIILGTKEGFEPLELKITYDLVDKDGPGGTLGYAGWRSLGKEWGELPTTGAMYFDKPDIESTKNGGNLEDLILHEMGHVLGLSSSLWIRKGLISPSCKNGNNTYLGDKVERFGQILIEDGGGGGTKCSHFDEEKYGDELMTGYLGKKNYLTVITVSALDDLGYIVDFNSDAIDSYSYTGNEGLDITIVIIISCGIVILCALIILTVLILLKRRKQRKNEKVIEKYARKHSFPLMDNDIVIIESI